MTDYVPLTKCLACNRETLVPPDTLKPWMNPAGRELVPYLNLGSQPLANAFHDGKADLPIYRLGLQVCPSCWHSQQMVAVDPRKMFTDYPYVSGTSETLKAYFKDFVEKVEKTFPEGKKLHVLDIGCNDSTLLNAFADHGHAIYGVDPAASSLYAEGAGHLKGSIYNGYWGEEAIKSLGLDSVDVIVAMNVLAHTDDPFTFLSLCKEVLAPGGRIYVQFSQRHMIDRCEFDTVYHEHISFFEPSSFLALLHRVGLRPVKHSEVEVHGGSSLWEIDAAPINPKVFPHDFEYWCSARSMDQYEAFMRRADLIKTNFKNACAQASEDGFTLVGYGAAAKANTFLNYCGVRLDYILDENPLKIGKLTPGMDIPVCTPSMVSSHPGRVMFVLTAWNFAPEIERKIRQLRPGFRDAFMVAYPELRIWE